MTYEEIAKVCYEANKAYAETLGEPAAEWEDVKESVMNGVKILVREPSLTSEQLHQAWMQEKLNQGWTWGPEKDFEKKLHPQLRVWHALSHEQQVKDYLFQAIVRVLAGLPKGYSSI